MLETDRMLLLIAVADCIRANDFTKSQPMLGICVDRIVDNELAAIPQGRNGLVFRNDRAPQDLRLAVPSRKKWPNGYELKCNFLDGSEFQKLRVQKYARTWEKYANIRFSFDAVQSAEIRISFNKDPVSWSAIGTDALIAIPQGRNGLVFRNDRAPQDLRLAVPSRKKWPNGYELKCNFLDGSEFQKLRVQKYARTWEKYANIRFSFDAV